MRMGGRQWRNRQAFQKAHFIQTRQEIDVTDEAARRTAELWERFLKTGTRSKAQLKAVSARNPIDYLQAIKIKG